LLRVVILNGVKDLLFKFSHYRGFIFVVADLTRTSNQTAETGNCISTVDTPSRALVQQMIDLREDEE
jgi:hypothetical protein